MTNEKLADELKGWAKDRRDEALDGYANAEELTELLDEAAQRLDAMPEGERIEGSIYDDYPMGDTYIFKARSAKQDERPATLTIRKRKEAP